MTNCSAVFEVHVRMTGISTVKKNKKIKIKVVH